VQQQFPELVSGDDGSVRAVDYSGLVGVLVAAINELGARNAALERRLDGMQAQLPQQRQH
jgi:hypothetical protein